MDRQTLLGMLERIRAKQAEAPAAFADTVQQMANQQLQSDALADVRNMALAALGVGAAGRGAVGLYNLVQNNTAPKKPKSGPAMLPLPYPVEPEDMPRQVLSKQSGFGDFLGGADAATKPGIPWYGPAMLATGMVGLGAGWKGLDYVLNKRRRAESEQDIEQARQEFHDALLSQYDAPLHSPGAKQAAAPSVMEKVGQDLDRLFDLSSKVLEKESVDWSNLGGAALGGYGMYAGLAGLLSGSIVYDKIQKRSRRAVLEKAMQRRQRRQFQQSPTEIYAVPEPMTHPIRPSRSTELQLINEPPE